MQTFRPNARACFNTSADWKKFKRWILNILHIYIQASHAEALTEVHEEIDQIEDAI